MNKTDSRSALLQVCVQDLYDGWKALANRLPGIARSAGSPELETLLTQFIDATAHTAEQAERSGHALDGPANLWMAGILDDARRDTETIAAGAPLDIAMVGAVRKAIAAEAVSIDTALTLMNHVDHKGLKPVLQDRRLALQARDAMLHALLQSSAQAI